MVVPRSPARYNDFDWEGLPAGFDPVGAGMVLLPESVAALLAMSAIMAQLLVAGPRKHQATRRAHLRRRRQIVPLPEGGGEC